MAFPTGWSYRQKLTIQNAQVPGTLTDCPVLITRSELHNDVVDPSGSNEAQADGGDIRFSSDSAGTTQLACEVVEFEHDATTGAGDAVIQLWVKVASISSSVDTDVYIWYNTAGTDSQPGVATTYGRNNTWDSAYEAVWHFGESSGSAVDSTGNGYDGTFNGSLPTQAAAQVGYGQDLDGTGDYALISQSFGTLFNGSNDFEVEAWCDLNTNSTRQTIFHPRDDFDVGLYYRGDLSNGYTFNFYDGSNNSVDVGSNQTTGVLRHVRGIWDSAGNIELWMDDSSQGTPIAKGTPDTLAADNLIGAQYVAPSNEYNGLLDEIRVHNGLRSTSRRTAEYNNQNSPSTFVVDSTPVFVGSGGLGIPLIMHDRRMRYNG